ncbi:MAG: hypothetical protein LBE65_03920 [Synergistaceae bacterium]|nr:hypothetical protein [Synergistaceae bacterium]
MIGDENGKKQAIKGKLVCYWSKKHYDKEARENEKFIEYLNSVIARPDKPKDKPGKIEKFLIKKSVDKKPGKRWTQAHGSFSTRIRNSTRTFSVTAQS